MSNFKPGDKAIFIGPIRNPYLRGYLSEGDEVTVLRPEKSPHDGAAGYRLDVLSRVGMPIFVLPCDLRKPDAYDITAQDWYQRILRGEKLEETV